MMEEVLAADAGEQARFSARAFVARWQRETGEQPSAVVTDRMLFAYEMGYLRGRSDGAQASGEMFDAARKRMKEDE